jgi:hypothetical protein
MSQFLGDRAGQCIRRVGRSLFLGHASVGPLPIWLPQEGLREPSEPVFADGWADLTWAGAPQLAAGAIGELGLPSSRVVA